MPSIHAEPVLICLRAFLACRPILFAAIRWPGVDANVCCGFWPRFHHCAARGHPASLRPPFPALAHRAPCAAKPAARMRSLLAGMTGDRRSSRFTAGRSAAGKTATCRGNGQKASMDGSVGATKPQECPSLLCPGAGVRCLALDARVHGGVAVAALSGDGRSGERRELVRAMSGRKPGPWRPVAPGMNR